MMRQAVSASSVSWPSGWARVRVACRLACPLQVGEILQWPMRLSHLLCSGRCKKADKRWKANTGWDLGNLDTSPTFQCS